MRQTISWRPLATIVVAVLLAVSDRGSCFFLTERGDPQGVIVQMFEWPFKDVAEECMFMLGPYGFAAVQVSPITEHVILNGRPWEERYEPVSYKIESRSGNESDFREMVAKCSRSEVKVYVDVVLNHMTKEYLYEMESTGGSKFDSYDMSYPALRYTKEHFHDACTYIAGAPDESYESMRNCRVDGRHDLDHSKYHVLCEITKFLNKLIEIGVAGFSIDAAKHMSPLDLKEIFVRLDYLNSYTGFVYDSKPFVFQDVTEYQTFPYQQYYEMGAVTDYKYSIEINRYFNGETPLKFIRHYTSRIPSEQAIVFVDNHLTERGLIKGIGKSLSYKKSAEFKLAMIFMLAWPHGTPKIMSGYKFYTTKEGPTSLTTYRALTSDGIYCEYEWTCVHRYKEVQKMVEFRKLAENTPYKNWWNSEKKNQIAFGRGDKAFVAINLDDSEMVEELQTGLEPGSYCDILSGDVFIRTCTGKVIIVNNDGVGKFKVGPKRAVAIHIWSISR